MFRSIRIFTFSTMISAMAMIADAVECKCTKFPFKPDPPCSTICPRAYLMASDQQDLTSILGLSTSLADKVLVAGRSPAAAKLTDQERELIQTRLLGLDEASLKAWASKLSPQALKSVRSEEVMLRYERVLEATKTKDLDKPQPEGS